MADDTKHLKQPNWGRDRGKNSRQNRGQYHERIHVEGYRREDGTYVKPYTRRPPSR